MGLGFSLVAKRPKRRYFGVFSREADWRAVIEQAITDNATRLGVEFLISLPSSDPNRIGSHYCEEWLDYKEVDDKIILTARTSTCGPGYHAFLIDVVDSLKESAQLSFEEDEENVDETGYFGSRNFSDLQKQHAEWLGALARQIVNTSNDGTMSMLISLAVHSILPTPTEGNVLTPRGPMTTTILSAIGKSERDEQLEYASTWFPWWNRSPTAVDLVRTAKSLMWVDVPWHVPATGSERHLMLAALQSCEKAKSLDVSADLPTREIAELKDLLAAYTPDSTRPSAEGIGYRRQICTHWLGADWSVELPGYWYTFEDGENGGLTFDGQEIWVSSYSVDKQPGYEHEPISLSQLKEDETEVLAMEDGFLRLRLTRQKPDEPNSRFTYLLLATRPDGLIFMTFSGDDPEWETDIPRLAKSLKPGRSYGDAAN